MTKKIIETIKVSFRKYYILKFIVHNWVLVECSKKLMKLRWYFWWLIDSKECFNQGKVCNRIVKLYDFEMYFKQLKIKKKYNKNQL